MANSNYDNWKTNGPFDGMTFIEENKCENCGAMYAEHLTDAKADTLYCSRKCEIQHEYD